MNKKEKIQALEARWGVKAAYLGAPSFAYEIKTEEQTIVIDRHGVAMDLQGREIFVEELYSKVQPAPVNEATPGASAEIRMDGYAVEFPLAGHTGASLRNLVNMISSKQKLLASAFGQTQGFMDSRFAEEINQKNPGSTELFQEAFLEIGPERCPGLEFNSKKRTVALKLVAESLSLDAMEAFRDLAICINRNAQTLKTSSFKPSQDENPKYAFRTWFIRLGLNGDEFKATRKVLLANLAGNSSFRSHKPENASDQGGVMDRFFTQKTCDRCVGSLSGGRIMSMYSTECICMACKEKEKAREDYKQAAQTELDEVRKGNMNYKGIKG